MVEGETTRFWIPENLAYRGQSPPSGLLVFDVELIKIQLGREGQEGREGRKTRSAGSARRH